MSTGRIAFLDVDGTILDHGRTVAASTVDAVRAARAAGHLVYLCTGRSAGDIHPDVAAIGFDGAITNGGSYATSGDDVVVARPMPRGAVDRLQTWFTEAGVPFFLQTNHGVYASAHVREMIAAFVSRWQGAHSGDEPQTSPQRPPRFGDLAEVDLGTIAKAVFVSDDPATVDRATAALGDRFHVVAGSMPLPGGTNGEIGMLGVTKGSAIETVLEHLGLRRDDAIGVGDSWNDVEMLQVCGTGIAMGNAPDELKALADDVTTSVSADGVANAFRRHGLI